MASPFSSTPIDRNKKTKRARVGSNSCPKCDVSISEHQDYIACSVCELNFCIECTNISPGLALALKEDINHNFKWACNGCTQNFPCMINLSQQLKSIEEATNNRLSSVEQKVSEIDQNMEIKIKQKVDSIKPNLIEEIKNDLKESLQKDVRCALMEIEDQRKRALNLIIFNLNESKSTSSLTRKSDDSIFFKEICTLIGVPEVDFDVFFRIGKQEAQTRFDGDECSDKLS